VREAVVSLADVRQSAVVEQDLLENEVRNGLRQLRAALHDPQAQRDDLGGEQERDDFLLVGLHQCPDDAETRQTQVLKGARFRRRVQERVEKQRNVSLEEAAATFWSKARALQTRFDCWAVSVGGVIDG
jgi:hypothetical protein